MSNIFFNKYWWIAKRLRTNQLQKRSSLDLSFSEFDLFKTDISQRGGEYFLGYYSKEGINKALKEYGIFKLLARNGFRNVFTVIDTSDMYKHKLSVYFEKKDIHHLLMELVLSKEFITIDMPFDTKLQHKKIETLKIDWMSMQNPLKQFTAKRPQLPGQKYPGLGFSHIAIKLLMIMNWRLNLIGLLNVPEHYHNACFYSKIFLYINPDTQAKFLALKKQLKSYNLSKLTWGMEWGCVIDVVNEKPFSWIVDNEIVPMDIELKKIMHGKEYKNYVKNKLKDYKFAFDEEKYNYHKNKTLKQDLENYI